MKEETAGGSVNASKYISFAWSWICANQLVAFNSILILLKFHSIVLCSNKNDAATNMQIHPFIDSRVRREALPRLDNYRQSVRALRRPSLSLLHGEALDHISVSGYSDRNMKSSDFDLISSYPQEKNWLE